MSGKLFIRYFASPKSCTIILSAPRPYTYLASSTASGNSSFLSKVFNVKSTLTFLSLAYLIASLSSAFPKLLAEALALNNSPPRYTLSAPA